MTRQPEWIQKLPKEKRPTVYKSEIPQVNEFSDRVDKCFPMENGLWTSFLEYVYDALSDLHGEQGAYEVMGACLAKAVDAEHVKQVPGRNNKCKYLHRILTTQIKEGRKAREEHHD